jgi:hypothetical protein
MPLHSKSGEPRPFLVSKLAQTDAHKPITLVWTSAKATEQALITRGLRAVGKSESGIGLVSHTYDPLHWYCLRSQLESL